MNNAPNVRIRSYAHPESVCAAWSIRPSEASDRMPKEVFPTADDLATMEPGMDWRIETRGEDSDWHEYK